MQFHKIEIKPSKRPAPHINYQRVCASCESRPVAGHVIGTGQYLRNTCLKCYRAAGVEPNDRGFSVHSRRKGGRS